MIVFYFIYDSSSSVNFLSCRLSCLLTCETAHLPPGTSSPDLCLFFLPSGSCAGSILPEGPLDELLGKNVTIKTLVDKPNYSLMIWTFSDDSDETQNIVTATPTEVKVNTPYVGRVSVNTTNGYLSLAGLKATDSGSYSINIVTKDLSTQTGEIRLRVLGESSTCTAFPTKTESLKEKFRLDPSRTDQCVIKIQKSASIKYLSSRRVSVNRLRFELTGFKASVRSTLLSNRARSFLSENSIM